jgi:hypothetical protein
MKFKLKGVDIYDNNGSTWLIFTEKKQWVIELTKEGTLWYNYYYFQSIICGIMGLKDLIDNQNFISKWVEDTIQNGVKKIKISPTFTEYGDWLDGDERLDEIIQNGIKETWGYSRQPQQRVNEIINGSIKETNWRKVDNHLTYLDNIINSNKC